ncbi:ead/Ea22-like family protein [Pseudescherichia sp.]|uniref:ead/Ea22-like family protein n=1 Tax=Pseudescherichia sp. TaxID=2055881 RepID=UPI0028A2A968|nr:ead/Ea22-like family protein [Pseudescherichia sp.]
MSDKYAALKQAAEKATSGEWCAFTDASSKTYSVHTAIDNRCGDIIKWPGFDGQKNARANAKFIAAANPATILELLAERDADKARVLTINEADVIHVLSGLRHAPGRMIAIDTLAEYCDASGISLKIEGE